MNKLFKITLGILTIIPIGTGIFLFGTVIVQMFTFFFSQEPNMLMLSYLAQVMAYIEYFILFYLLIGIYYLIHIFQNKYIDTEKKFLWTIVLISFNGLAMPIYWYMHIWRSDKAASNY